MSAVKQIQAVARDQVGKGAARAVRRQGQVPAVIYGGGEPATPIALDFNQTKQMIFAGHFLTTIFEIDVNGRTTRAIPRDYQLDPVRDFPVHVDFLRLSEGQTLRVTVPVHVVGQENSPGLKRGGTLNVVLHEVLVACHADQIPDEIMVDLTGLEIGDTIRVSDLKLPKGVEAAVDADATVATVATASVMAEADEAADTATAEEAVAEAAAEAEAEAEKGGEE